MGLTEKLTEMGESHAEIERLNIESNAKLEEHRMALEEEQKKN